MSMDKTRALAEMGIKPVWRLRQPFAEAVAAPAIAIAQAEDTAENESASQQLSLQSVLQSAAQSTEKPAAQSVPQVLAQPVVDMAADTHAARIMGWDELASTVASCRACSLCETRKQTVFGVGDRQADWMFVGEGPGAEEDLRGEPFVGQPGKLLDAMLEASSLKRGENVYIANAVKCRPPGNRTPEPEEVAACRPYLERQIELVKPKLLIALGRPAAQTLLGSETSIASARGKLHRYGDTPVVVTYHPAYLLRNLPDKAKAWVDLCFAADTIARLGD